VALGGIAAEYVTYGQANGGMSDIIQLEEPWDPLVVWGCSIIWNGCVFCLQNGI